MLVELQQLMAKENDLKKKIATFESKGNVMHVDRVVEVIMPKEKDKDKEKEPMRTVVKVSSFDRVMKLESELNKVRGRILKLIDSIKSYELECKRITLEEKKYKLMKQRVTGAYEIDPEIGDIDDVYEEYEDKG